MLTKILLVTTTAALAVLGVAGCALGSTTRTQVCQQFDDLGTKVANANGLFDNPVFSEASDLADTASHYPGTPNLGSDAASLRDIADSDSTSGLELENATTHIAELCGHPFGIGTTDYANGNSDGQAGGGSNWFGFGNSNSGDNSGNSGPQQGYPSTGDTPNYQEQPPSYPQDTPTSTQNAVTGESSAQAALQAQLAADRPAVEALVGQWVPQLSSKTYGLVANGITYDYQQIWQDFESISQAHPGALLAWSSDYTSFQLTNYYVTLLPISYSSGSQAAGWCTSNGLGPNDCYGKLISHTAGPKGSSVQP
jgi:hypothetical protein